MVRLRVLQVLGLGIYGLGLGLGLYVSKWLSK